MLRNKLNNKQLFCFCFFPGVSFNYCDFREEDTNSPFLLCIFSFNIIGYFNSIRLGMFLWPIFIVCVLIAIK